MIQANATTLPQPLAAQARARPDHPALLDEGGARLTFAELAHLAATRARALLALGVVPGQRVALVATASLDVAGWLHALWWMGAVAVPLPVRGPAAETAGRIAATAPRWWLRHGGESAEALAPLVEADLACLDLAAGPRAPQRPPDRGDRRAAAWPGPAAPGEVGPRPWALAAEVAVVTTSGSTGAPKAVALTVTQVVFSAFGSATRLGHLPADVWLGVLPLHHVGGLSLMFRTVLLGCTLRLHGGFDAAQVASALACGAASLVSLVPTMLAAVLAAAPEGPFHPNLRAVLLGGAPPPAALLAAARGRGVPVAVSWGMSEAASQIATQWPTTAASGPGDAGPPLPFAQVEADGAGRLHVAGPLVQGPLATSDVGRVSPSGHVVVDGRMDDVFISGGENVHPAPIEARLLAHPAVAEAAVVPVADPRWGQRPLAFLVAAGPQAPPSDAELALFCRATLASFQLPVQFVWLDRLPRDNLGKLRRRALCNDAERAALSCAPPTRNP